MNAEKMIRPPPMRLIRFIRAIAIAFSIVGAPFLIAGVITLIDDPGMAMFCFIPGLPLTVGPILWFRQMTRRRAAFQASQRTANATVIDRSKEKPRHRGTGPLLLEAGMAVADRVKPMFEYFLILEFSASKTGMGSMLMTLEAQVNELVYEDHPPGSTFRIRYAMDDPRIALPESEYAAFSAEA
jgi:hypothetical protein